MTILTLFKDTCSPDTIVQIGRMDDLYPKSNNTFPPPENYKLKKRQREFSTGRFLLSKCLNVLGEPGQHFFEKHTSGYPFINRDIIGSISHSKNHVCAAVTTNARKFLGIDCEEIISEETWAKIGSKICPMERNKDVFLTMKRATICFSAKEAIYKAVFPKCHKWFYFDAIEILNITDEEFEFRFTKDLGPFSKGHSAKGSYNYYQNICVTFINGNLSIRQL